MGRVGGEKGGGERDGLSGWQKSWVEWVVEEMGGERDGLSGW